MESYMLYPLDGDIGPDTPEVASAIEKALASSDVFDYDPAKYSFCKEKSIVNTLNVGGTGLFSFMTEIKKGIYGIALHPDGTDADYEKYVDEIEAALPECARWKNRRPNIGDFVFGQTEERIWLRGYIISVVPMLRLAMIDELQVSRIDDIATCEPPLDDIYAFTGICELTDTTHKLEEFEDYRYRVIGRTDNEKPDEFEILILKGDFEFKATIKPWIPTPEVLGIPLTDLDSGTPVCLTSYLSQIVMFIRPINALGLARHNFIMETVAKCAEISEFVQDPQVGQPALGLRADGKYYRGLIITVEKERLELTFEDLASREFVDRKKTKNYPETLDKLGYCMSKIRLQDVPKNIPPVQSIINLLDNLVENEVPLICTYDGIPTIDGVYLKYPDGGSVNEMICKCIEECRKRKKAAE